MATTVIPHLACRNATAAYDFYQKAFGATPMGLMITPDDRVMHGTLAIDGAMVFLADEFPEHGGKSPELLGGSPVTIHLQVDDCDKVFATATEAGCTVLMPLEEMFWGDRYGLLCDPFGHTWSVATTVKQISPEEMAKGAEAMAGEMCVGAKAS